MKFDLISDFHVEMNDKNKNHGGPVHYPWDEDIQSDVLVIAGDTSNSPIKSILVLMEAATYYKHVIFVDGNHEHYSGYQSGTSVDHNMNFLEVFAKNTSSVTYLRGTNRFRYNDVVFLGANGWYDWEAAPLHSREEQHAFWKSDMNDSRCILFGPNGYPDKLADQQSDAIASQVREFQNDQSVREIVLVTHTVPVVEGLRSHTDQYGHLNGSYCNTKMQRVLDADSNSKISTWVFGHTHDFRDFYKSGVRFVSNPRGYRGERRDGIQFDGVKQIDTEDRRISAFGEIEC